MGTGAAGERDQPAVTEIRSRRLEKFSQPSPPFRESEQDENDAAGDNPSLEVVLGENVESVRGSERNTETDKKRDQKNDCAPQRAEQSLLARDEVA